MGYRSPRPFPDANLAKHFSKKKNRPPQTERRRDVFEIVSGALGPVPACKLRIRPLTVFVGPQGTGKSLVAQLLFAMEELPFLLYAGSLERGWSRKSDPEAFRWVLDRLRSADRAFATFSNPTTSIRWTRGSRTEWPKAALETISFSMYQKTRQINLRQDTRRSIEALRKTIASSKQPPLHHAIYFPTERLSVAGQRSRLAGKAFPQPITYDVFEHWLEEHVVPEVSHWTGGVPPNETGRKIDALGLEALRGRARKLGERWKWEFGSGRSSHKFDLDMASSGQRANFAIPYIAKALFELRGTGDVSEQLTLLIEEPEISLHPASQWAVMKLLALLVNSGFRVVLTTHSLTIVYALNNLLQAALIKQEGERIPEPDLRLDERDVAVYAFHEGEKPRRLIDRRRAFIDEAELGRVDEQLSAELSRVSALLPPKGEST